MALQLITPPLILGPPMMTATTANTFTLDALSEYVAWVFRAPKTGTIDRIHWRAGAVTANGDGLRQRIETVNAADGLPSGTLVTSSAEITHVTTTADSWNRGTAGLTAAVTKGDLIAAKLSSPAAGTTFNGVIQSSWSNLVNLVPTSGIFPYTVNALPAGAKAQVGVSTFAIEYDDATTPYIMGVAPVNAVASASFNNTSTPDERGNLIQVPFPCRCIGIWTTMAGGGSTATFDVVLYSSADAVLATVSLDPDQTRTVGSLGYQMFYFSAAVSLTAATNYRVVVKPTSANSCLSASLTVDTATGGTRLREAMINSTWKTTTRTDAGAWTETDDSLHSIGLIVDQFDDGVGGGSANLMHGKIQ